MRAGPPGNDAATTSAETIRGARRQASEIIDGARGDAERARVRDTERVQRAEEERDTALLLAHNPSTELNIPHATTTPGGRTTSTRAQTGGRRRAPSATEGQTS